MDFEIKNGKLRALGENSQESKIRSSQAMENLYTEFSGPYSSRSPKSHNLRESSIYPHAQKKLKNSSGTELVTNSADKGRRNSAPSGAIQGPVRPRDSEKTFRDTGETISNFRAKARETLNKSSKAVKGFAGKGGTYDKFTDKKNQIRRAMFYDDKKKSLKELRKLPTYMDPKFSRKMTEGVSRLTGAFMPVDIIQQDSRPKNELKLEKQRQNFMLKMQKLKLQQMRMAQLRARKQQLLNTPMAEDPRYSQYPDDRELNDWLNQPVQQTQQEINHTRLWGDRPLYSDPQRNVLNFKNVFNRTGGATLNLPQRQSFFNRFRTSIGNLSNLMAGQGVWQEQNQSSQRIIRRDPRGDNILRAQRLTW